MNVYMIPVTLQASLYVMAESADDARRIVKEKGEISEISADGREHSDVPFSNAFFDTSMPQISLSPVMTVESIDLTHIELSNDDIEDGEYCSACGRDGFDCSKDPCTKVRLDRER